MAFLPQIAIAEELKGGRLILLNWSGEPFHMLTQVAWHKDKWLSPAFRAFLEVVQEVMHE